MTTTIQWHPRHSANIALDEDDETQKELAQRLGWETSKLSRLLSGKQKGSFGDWLQIANAQGRDITYYVAPSIDLNGYKGVYLRSLAAA
jgi:transcriptional regulator with XRE-family HTH domain